MPAGDRLQGIAATELRGRVDHRVLHRAVEGCPRLLEEGGGVGLRRLPLRLRLADRLREVDLRRDDLLDLLVGLEDRVEQRRFGELVGAGLDHHHRVAGAGDDEIELGDVPQAVGRVHDQLAVDEAHAHGADRIEERDVGEGERRRGAVERQHVGIVLAVGREHEGDDLRLVVVPLGEQRAQRPVDQAGGDDLLLGRPPLALEEAARDAPGGIGVLLVVDGQGEEVALQPLSLGHRRRGEHHRVAVAHDHRAVCLARHAAGLEAHRLAADLDLSTFGHDCAFFLLLRRRLPLDSGQGRAVGAGGGCRRAPARTRSAGPQQGGRRPRDG